MAIKVICEECGYEKLVKDKYIGTVIECPECGEDIDVVEEKPKKKSAGKKGPKGKPRGRPSGGKKKGSGGGRGKPPKKRSRGARRAPAFQTKAGVFTPLAFLGICLPILGIVAFFMARGEKAQLDNLIEAAEEEEDDDRLDELEEAHAKAGKMQWIGLGTGVGSFVVGLILQLVFSTVSGGARQTVQDRGVNLTTKLYKELATSYHREVQQAMADFDYQASYSKHYDKYYNTVVDGVKAFEGEGWKDSKTWTTNWKKKKPEIEGGATKAVENDRTRLLKSIRDKYNVKFQGMCKGFPEFTSGEGTSKDGVKTFGAILAYKKDIETVYKYKPRDGEKTGDERSVKKTTKIPPLSSDLKYKKLAIDEKRKQTAAGSSPKVYVRWLFGEDDSQNGTMRFSCRENGVLITVVLKY